MALQQTAGDCHGRAQPLRRAATLAESQSPAPDGIEVLARFRVRAVVAILLPLGVLNILLQMRGPLAQVLDAANLHPVELVSRVPRHVPRSDSAA